MKLSNFYKKVGNTCQRDRGFTLIELIVVMIFISILATISLPTLLSNIAKSRESEATMSLGTLSRSQQSYHLENREFADTMNKLSNTIALNSKYYNFPDPSSASSILVKHQAVPLNVGINQTRNYASGTYFDPLSGNFDIVICQGKTINSSIDAPNSASGSCTNGGKKIK